MRNVGHETHLGLVTTRTAVGFKDLHFLSIECSACGTRSVLDVARPGFEIPRQCSCGSEFSAPNYNVVKRFVQVYNDAKDSPNLGVEIAGMQD